MTRDRLKVRFEQLRHQCISWCKLERKRDYLWLVGIIALVVGIYILSKADESPPSKLVDERNAEFKRSRILGDPFANFAGAKERQIDRFARDYSDAQRHLGEGLARLDSRLADLERRFAVATSAATSGPQPSTTVNQSDVDPAETGYPVDDSTAAAAPPVVSSDPELMSNAQTMPSRPPLDLRPNFPKEGALPPNIGATGLEAVEKGPSVISFPVKGEELRERREIVLPPGAYVKGKMLTGVEAPEGTPYPVLIQLDFAHILPNRKSLDLSGCFVIAKAEGNLSIERVKMQATKLSCVARSGQMFERDINGFVADADDNSFGMIGEVNSKQDRVAAMAFLSAVVEGAGRAIQMAQMSEERAVDGSSHQNLTGNQGKYIASGGISQAGSMVAQWYLKQAQGLLPTINIGSGRDVWIVMHESIALPQNYFKKISGDRHGKDYSFVSRLLDQ